MYATVDHHAVLFYYHPGPLYLLSAGLLNWKDHLCSSNVTPRGLSYQTEISIAQSVSHWRSHVSDLSPRAAATRKYNKAQTVQFYFRPLHCSGITHNKSNSLMLWYLCPCCSLWLPSEDPYLGNRLAHMLDFCTWCLHINHPCTSSTVQSVCVYNHLIGRVLNVSRAEIIFTRLALYLI